MYFIKCFSYTLENKGENNIVYYGKSKLIMWLEGKKRTILYYIDFL